MKNLFGNKDALIGSIDLFVGAIMVLGAFIFRKSVANDMLNMGFSVVGSSGCGILAYLILNNIFHILKLSVGAGLIAFFAGGFLLANIIGDGEADGGNKQ